MISLQPTENYTIVRQLQDHTDPTVYFVQAVVRDSISDTVLATINLTDKGSDRFKAPYQVPSDVSGLGFYIDITTSVYVDNAYTAKAPSYGDENESYLVFDRITRMGGGGGGGETEVDYKKIKKLITDAIAGIEKPDGIDLQPVLDRLAEINKTINAIEIPENEKVELSGIIGAISDAQKSIETAISAKPVTPATDLSPVLREITANRTDPTDLSPVLDQLSTLGKSIDSFLTAIEEGRDSSDRGIVDMANSLSTAVMGLKDKNIKKESALKDRVKRLTS